MSEHNFPKTVTVSQCQEKYSSPITEHKFQLAFHSYLHVSKPKGKCCHGVVRGDKRAFAWTARLCSGIVQMEWSQEQSLAARVCHNLLKQTQMLISPRQVVWRVSKVQEGSVISILFLRWFNYYSSIVTQNMWGPIVRPAGPMEPLQWVHCLSCLTSSWGLMNFWTPQWDFLFSGKLNCTATP